MAELRKYGVSTSMLFPLIERDVVDFEAGATFAAGDVQMIKDEGAAANTTNLPIHEGNGIYSLTLTASEMQAARIVVTIIDQTASKVWEDQAVLIETYGAASAQHAFDLDKATQDVTVSSITAGVVTAAAFATDALEAIADKVLDRPIANVEPAAAFRTLYGAVASLVNRRRINAGNVEVFKTDDATNLANLSITEDSGQDPISELDP